MNTDSSSVTRGAKMQRVSESQLNYFVKFPEELIQFIYSFILNGNTNLNVTCKRIHNAVKCMYIHVYVRYTSTKESISIPIQVWSPLLCTIDLSHCINFTALPNEIGLCINLKQLNLYQCSRLRTLPDGLCDCVNLENLNLRGCFNLISLPEQIGKLENLIQLNLYICENLTFLPDSLGGCVNLRFLDISGCDKLVSIPKTMSKCIELRHFRASSCTNLKILPDISNSKIEKLELLWCYRLVVLPEMPKTLIELNVQYCIKLTKIPESIIKCTFLECIIMKHCKCITELPNRISECSKLGMLDITGCTSLTILPDEIDYLIFSDEDD